MPSKKGKEIKDTTIDIKHFTVTDWGPLRRQFEGSQQGSGEQDYSASTTAWQ